jgi:hypothetical protein
MLIYVLEDEQYRVDFFRKNFPKAEIKHFGNATEIIESIKNERRRIDILFIDYDLDFGEHKSGTNGRELSIFLQQHQQAIDTIIIHSVNSFQSVKMKRDLSKYNTYWLPFYIFYKDEYDYINFPIDNFLELLRRKEV